ncbi:MAG: dTDP-4-dehydrorhamnose reductase [Candidatus Omnitrophica bacterium]|nr:dTDP-4-dehydrorhamnose reductase [Candidatus Omnitrophota bacterium]MBU4478308.1 dTDP-4-dehydrorhamnose reductase [Candidatus Omnitrophota bacterium]MCG2703453.1 dTDP-4-dehydrorhamnose reductase [Candidatus Omnitrophota bacterium]
MVEETKKSLLITGAAGMLGEDLLRLFSPRYAVSGIDVRTPKYKDADFIACDLLDSGCLEDVFRVSKPWLVLHAAAYTDVDGCERDPERAERINAALTGNLVRLCKKHNAKLVYISTDYVFDGTKHSAYNENDAPNPLNVYGRSKLNGEITIREKLEEFLIIRTSWLFGHYGRNFVSAIINKALEEKTLHVVDDQRGSPTYTVSLARAIDGLIEAVFIPKTRREYCGIYHISNSGNCSWYEFAKAIIDLKGIAAEVIPVDSMFVKRPACRPVVSILDNRRYEQVTAQRLCHWQEALKYYLGQEEQHFDVSDIVKVT